ncbi:RluA family pseudouridine synthase, partial [Patescibacteria group bacterium]|nr:RluA family pseudouridine synthase [Patescibacteria group bacterium]
MKITIRPKDKIDRLDKLIASKLPNLSRAFIQKQIKDGSITVNSDKTTAHFKPSIGDIIEIKKTEKDLPDISPNKDIKFDIIEEAKDFLVINKPSGLVVHPAEGIHEQTLVNGLLAKYPDIANIGEDESCPVVKRSSTTRVRPGIVHRLDRNVSGLMVIARTQKMFNHLKKQFQERATDKEYIALVHGIIEDEDGMIDTPIGRSQTKHGKMA